jgi:nucleotide-binding universal stress UspA family protein
LIKDIMVRLDGSAADETRLAMAHRVADSFQGHIIGLFVNVLPLLPPVGWEGVGSVTALDLIEAARAAGDAVEARLTQQLEQLGRPMEIRRVDAFAEDLGLIAAREARAADVFIAMHLGGTNPEPRQLVETVLFESGRHLLLVPGGKPPVLSFERALVAWNGSRESARAVAEAMPYLGRVKSATIVVVDDGAPVDETALKGGDLKRHLRRHGVDAVLHHTPKIGSIAATIVAAAARLDADLVIMGGYGHSRLREWLLGGVTREITNAAADVPLLIAH